MDFVGKLDSPVTLFLRNIIVGQSLVIRESGYSQSPVTMYHSGDQESRNWPLLFLGCSLSGSPSPWRCHLRSLFSAAHHWAMLWRPGERWPELVRTVLREGDGERKSGWVQWLFGVWIILDLWAEGQRNLIEVAKVNRLFSVKHYKGDTSKMFKVWGRISATKKKRQKMLRTQLSGYTCRLAPTGYDAERALGDANNPSLQIAALLAVGWHPLGSMQAIQADLQTNFGLVHLWQELRWAMWSLWFEGKEETWNLNLIGLAASAKPWIRDSGISFPTVPTVSFQENLRMFYPVCGWDFGVLLFPGHFIYWFYSIYLSLVSFSLHAKCRLIADVASGTDVWFQSPNRWR